MTLRGTHTDGKPTTNRRQTDDKPTATPWLTREQSIAGLRAAKLWQPAPEGLEEVVVEEMVEEMVEVLRGREQFSTGPLPSLCAVGLGRAGFACKLMEGFWWGRLSLMEALVLCCGNQVIGGIEDPLTGGYYLVLCCALDVDQMGWARVCWIIYVAFAVFCFLQSRIPHTSIPYT